MRRIKINIACNICGLLFCLFFLAINKTVPVNAENLEYNIQTILPENQEDKSKSDFDLKMKPGEKQTIYIYINNMSATQSTYNIAINQAHTNEHGRIDYLKTETTFNNPLNYSIDDIVQYESSVNVDANSSLKYPIELTMPTEEFSGQILAGIVIYAESEKVDNPEDSTQLADYIIGLNITQNTNELTRDLKINNLYPTVVLDQVKIIVQLSTSTMEAYEQLTYVTRLTNHQSNKIIFSETHDEQQLAPNSDYNLTINWDTKNIISGNYDLDLIANDEKGNQWVFEESFEVNSEKANELNTAIKEYTKQKNKSLYLYLTLFFFSAIFLASYFFLKNSRPKNRRRSRRKKKKMQNKQRNKNSLKKPEKRTNEKRRKPTQSRMQKKI